MTVATQDCINVTKNGTNQTGLVNGQWTLVTFSTKVVDLATAFSTSTSLWTPNTSVAVLMQAQVRVLGLGGENARMDLKIVRINGSTATDVAFASGHTEDLAPASGTGVAAMANVIHIAKVNSGDTFGVYVRMTTPRVSNTQQTGIIDGSASETYFTGVNLGNFA